MLVMTKEADEEILEGFLFLTIRAMLTVRSCVTSTYTTNFSRYLLDELLRYNKKMKKTQDNWCKLRKFELSTLPTFKKKIPCGG
jgi:hypothetical protein